MKAGDKYMLRAIELARKGLGQVSPNPLVGCIIVHEDRIIGEGYHKKYGLAHAEVNAINSVADSNLLPSSTLYVTLEPCAHQGKTPPCADLIIEKKIKKVIIGVRDPFAEVNGKGIEKLKNAGIVVEANVLGEECQWMNRRFFTLVENDRPYIILKWAQTQNGFIARENFDSKWISNPYSRQLVHKWRAEEDAILVGKNTVIHDNPNLTVRDWVGRNPVRIVLDHDLKTLNGDFSVYDNSAETILANQTKEGNTFTKFDGTAASLVAELARKNIQSVIIEGGAKTLSEFIDSGFWDEARVFTAKKTFELGIAAPALKGEIISEEDIMGDRLQIIRNVDQG